ncbi:unnamed protein product [Phyllotreta striolata]|uniref:Uncharacterized protein n=1 Tax=Phyllotreta striolata TaxID=444603 RepID=A0A9N9TPP6_PHYSR|nr:unnamed protein product [Phyllotreta striolata]
MALERKNFFIIRKHDISEEILKSIKDFSTSIGAGIMHFYRKSGYDSSSIIEELDRDLTSNNITRIEETSLARYAHLEELPRMAWQTIKKTVIPGTVTFLTDLPQTHSPKTVPA